MSKYEALMDAFTGSKLKSKSRKKWDELLPMGRDICDLFLPIKSPYNNQLNAPMSTFKGRHLNHFLKRNPQYGAVINLCLTKYYQPIAVEEAGVEFHHLPSMSHDELTPNREAKDAFVNLVNDIRTRKPSCRIIVHCTHGCNRTGYMIATYLAEYMGMDLFEALKLFAEKRPPGMYHIDGIDNFLKERYGDPLPEEQSTFLSGLNDRFKNTVFSL